jgi:hypothetical protein
MKVLLSSLILFCIVIQSSFAACEGEKERRDRNRSLCNQWCEYSAAVTVAGAVIGSVVFSGPWGGLCGAAGLGPGAVAKRICDLADQKDEIVKQCEENQVRLNEEAVEKAKDQFIEKQAEAASVVLTHIFMKKKNHFEKVCHREIDQLIESYVDSDLDLSDPLVSEQLKSEIAAIQGKYF